MRIIDADRAKEIVDTSVGDFILALAMRNLLDRVPTEDAAPVVHGHWIEVAILCGIEVLKCSVCGRSHPMRPTAFCGDCGAMMDGNLVKLEERAGDKK